MRLCIYGAGAVGGHLAAKLAAAGHEVGVIARGRNLAVLRESGIRLRHGEQEIAPGGSSGKHWHMSDEVVYAISGKGHSLQWDVEADIDDKYYARVATEPSRWEFTKGDVLYVPQNTVHQQFADGDEPLRLLVAQNRIFKHLGYDSVVHLEDAKAGTTKATAAAR